MVRLWRLDLSKGTQASFRVDDSIIQNEHIPEPTDHDSQVIRRLHGNLYGVKHTESKMTLTRLTMNKTLFEIRITEYF
jgi:hypothetical protein